MTDSTRAELRALLTRAADCEAARQQAVRDHDHARVEAYENELRDLYRRHAELERSAA